MALLTVHLLVAHRWAEKHPAYLDNCDFYLGAISPDAVHIRDKDDKSRKNYFHLGNWNTPHPHEVNDYWKNCRTPFDVGYGIHVLTDAQWVPRFHQITELFPDGVHLDKRQYYHDTFLTDFELYNRSPLAKELYHQVSLAQIPTDHPLLWAHELEAWRTTTLTTYAGPCPMQGTPSFIDTAYVDLFIEECLPLLEETWSTSFS